MSECPSSTLRNARKHFVKCVDCGCQTLPQNASDERPWTAAASLYIGALANDGALCFDCANKRRKALGLPVEKEHEKAANPEPAWATMPRTVRVNGHEYTWEVSTLESLLTKWRDECSPKSFENRAINHLMVSVNNKFVRAVDFRALPISDGDTIVIVFGAVAGG